MFVNGVSVVASLVGGVPYGMSIAWATQVEEKHLIVSLPRHSATTEMVLKAGCFTVNILAASQKELAVKFGSTKKPGTHLPGHTFAGHALARHIFAGHTFEGVDHVVKGRAVVIAECHSAIFCELESAREIGKQLVVVGLVKELEVVSGSASPLIYKKSDYFGD